jgi:adenylate cyclase
MRGRPTPRCLVAYNNPPYPFIIIVKVEGEWSLPDVERRLAAIVAIDVAGYSRLMGVDEAGTLTRLKEHRAATEPIGQARGGRIVGTAGDGILWEFPSVVEAVTCAIEVQAAMAERNAGISGDTKMLFRMGINLGDVLVDGDDIYGDGVNVAARLEALAEPGGIAISGNAHDQVHGKLDVAFQDQGRQSLKNIERPVAVWAWQPGTAAADTISIAGEPLPLSDKPSIAVLAFDNMSGDPDQEYFADGLTEDIITALSCWHLFPVISRSSSFAFKGRQLTIDQISRQLGARYVVEGSVRSSGDRVRISAQLIDAEMDHHLWAERYDRELSDVFAVQEEIAFRIASAIEPAAIRSAATKSLRRPNSPDAWDCALRGWWHLWQMNKAALAEARTWFQQAIERDPMWSDGYSGLAAVGIFSVFLVSRSLKPEALSEVERTASRAIALDHSDAYAHLVVGVCASYQRDVDAALVSINRALNLNPSLAMAHYCKGTALICGGRPEAGLQSVQNAIQLSPHDPFLPVWTLDLGMANYLLGRYDRAIVECEKALRMQPRWTAAMALKAANLSRLGNRREAGDLFEKVKVIIPDYRLEGLHAAFQILDSDFEMLVNDLRLAGWDS